MVTLFQVDKSGNDVFDKDYSIVLIKDKSEIYGVNIPQNIKDKLNFIFNKKGFNFPEKSKKQK